MKSTSNKTTFTLEEVQTIIQAVGVKHTYNPDIKKEDLPLLELVGYKFGSVENGHGGYTYLEYRGKKGV